MTTLVTNEAVNLDNPLEPKTMVEESVADTVAPLIVDKVTDLRTRIAEAAIDDELKLELVELMDNMERAAKVLKVYADRKNWRKEWMDNPRGYSWVFTNVSFYLGQQNMEPSELMERIDRTVNAEEDKRFNDKGVII